MRVRNMTGRTGATIPNQFIVEDDRDNSGEIYFQSYGTVIAKKENGKIILDISWDSWGPTTGKYRNQFLGETKKETEKKIADGTYQLKGLN